MTMLYVQFDGPAEEKIISFFGGPQDPGVWPNQGTVDTSDPRWHEFYDAFPDLIKPYLPTPD